MGVFTFLNCTNSTKLRKASHMPINLAINDNLRIKPNIIQSHDAKELIERLVAHIQRRQK